MVYRPNIRPARRGRPSGANRGPVRIEATGTGDSDAVTGVVAGRAAASRLGIGCRWGFASAGAGGRLLASTTSSFPGPLTG